MNPVRVGDVDNLLVRREADAIWAAESVGYGADASGVWIVSVDLVRKLRAGTVALLEAVDRIGEPDTAIAVDDNVIDGIEVASVEVIQHQSRGVGRRCRHVE